MIFWQISTTLDGFMEAENGDLAFTAGVTDDDFEEYASEMLQAIKGMVLGRRTYQVFNAYWPTAAGVDADRMNELPKLVFSKTLDSVDWSNARLATGDLRSEIENFRNEAGGDIAIFGSSTLAASITDEGLIDEYRILVTPFVLGNGHAAFGAANGIRTLTLDRSENWQSGTVALFYKTTKEKTR